MCVFVYILAPAVAVFNSPTSLLGLREDERVRYESVSQNPLKGYNPVLS